MQMNINLEDLIREAEDDCPNCGGIGVPECDQCHGRAKILNEQGKWLVRFIARHFHEIVAAGAYSSTVR